MPIYKYTIKKYLKSYSTWVIILISMTLIILVGGVIPFSLMSDKKLTGHNYSIVSFSLISLLTTFLALFTSIFSGFKAATMYKDEVEDGTFLVMLSKPITRSKIIFSKWFALIAMLIIYTFIISLTFMFTLIIFDNGYKLKNLSFAGIPLKTLRSESLIISLYLWVILFVTSLIFSSISILLSTKLSVGTTIGISIGIGVIIPVTSVIGLFLKKDTYSNLSSINSNILVNTTKTDSLEKIYLELKKQNPSLPSIPKSLMPSDLGNLEGTNEVPTLYNIGISNNDKDPYKNAWLLDINFQISTLSEFASDTIIPDGLKEVLSADKVVASRSGITPSRIIKDGKGLDILRSNILNNSSNKQSNEQKELIVLNNLINNTYKSTKKSRELFNLLVNKIYWSIQGNKTFEWAIPKTSTYAETYKDIFGNTNPLSKNSKGENLVTEKTIKILADLDFENLDSYKKLRYFSLMAENMYLSENNSKWISQLSDDYKNIKTQLHSVFQINLSSILWSLVDPMHWINAENISALMQEHDLKKEDLQDFDLVMQESGLTSKSPILDPKNSNFSPILFSYFNKEPKHAIEKYTELASLFSKGYQLEKITSKKYAEKNNILIAYIIIAILLMPLAYYMVKRQDFK